MVCKNIEDLNGEEVDPHDIFMNGSLNVVTGFALGKIYDYKDSDFIRYRKRIEFF